MSSKKVSFFYAFKEIIWPKRNIVFVGLVLILLSKMMSFVPPLSLKYLMDDILPNKNLGFLKNLVAIVILAIFVQSLTSFLLTRLLSVQAQYTIAKLRTQIKKKILSLPIQFFDDSKSGELVSRIMNDVEGVHHLIGTGLVQLIGGGITTVVSLFFLFNISLSLTLFALIPLIIFAAIALKAFKILRPIFYNHVKINAEVTGRLTETLGGIRTIKAFNAEKQELTIFDEGVKKLYQNVKNSLITSALVTSSTTFLLGVATTCIMGFGGYKIMINELSLGEFLTFTFLLGLMIAPIVQIGDFGSQLTEALAGIDRTKELMNLVSEGDDNERKITLEKIHGNMVFKDVSFAYKENEVLQKINFTVQPGSVIALAGSSGSGKSTIAGLASSFLTPQSGVISIDGKNLSEVNLASYRRHLGVVLQDDFLFEGTIRENILFSRPEASECQLLEAVKIAYVDQFSDSFDDGLNTLIGERGVKLSGGQRQRIAIARAVLANPKILIFDEATSNLDTESEALIQKSITKLTKGRTTIIIAHRLTTIRNADQILVIEDGSIVERGNHNELMSRGGRYYDLYTFQTRT